MIISTKPQLVLLAVFDIAHNQHKGPVSLKDISERQGISNSYLEQFASKLKQSGYIESTRGPGGGYELTEKGQGASVHEIISSVVKYERQYMVSGSDHPDCVPARELLAGVICSIWNTAENMKVRDLTRN